MDSRGPTYSSARQAGQRTILSIDRSPQVMQEQLEVRLMARKSYNLCYPGMHSRQAINTGAGLEGLTTLQPHSWHPWEPTRRVKGYTSKYQAMVWNASAVLNEGLRTEDWHMS
jgi:hypothetical protein